MANDWNTQVINEFRANGGQLGGNFSGAPMTLLHHKGRKSGKDYVAPVMYQADDADQTTIYVFASYGGAPQNPAWYENLTAAGKGRSRLAARNTTSRFARSPAPTATGSTPSKSAATPASVSTR